MQVIDSIICGYSCMVFVDYILNNKIWSNFNSFVAPNNFKGNNKRNKTNILKMYVRKQYLLVYEIESDHKTQKLYPKMKQFRNKQIAKKDLQQYRI